MKDIRKAATLVLVRGRNSPGFEVFMVERPGSAAFGGLHVFPGGKVDPADRVDAAHCDGLSDEAASAWLGVPEGGLAYWVAAIRESFEEAGVLLGRLQGRLIETADPQLEARFQRHREALVRGELKMSDLCLREEIVLAADRVHYFSHWITPEGAPARFDTRFFLAVMPENQIVSHHAEELEDGLWITPQEALSHHVSGRWRMIYPTLTTLETLARFDTIEALVAAVQSWSHLPEVTDERNRQGMQRRSA
jgi:8-oxo-dGTP pyrophosphatase MutT (NUDIX family)